MFVRVCVAAAINKGWNCATMQVGVGVGVVLNRMLPPWLLSILLVLLMCVLVLQAWGKVGYGAVAGLVVQGVHQHTNPAASSAAQVQHFELTAAAAA